MLSLLKDGGRRDDALVRFRMRCHVVDAVRADRRRSAREEALVEVVATGPGLGRDLELRTAVDDILGSLSTKARHLVVRYYFDDATLAEIAREAGVSAGSVEQSLHRARIAMKRRLDRSGEDGTILEKS